VAAQAVTVLLMRRSILTEKVARRGHHVIREYSVDPLDQLRVGEVMDRSVPTISAEMKVTDLADRIARGDPRLSRRQGTPIVDAHGRLVGIITRSDVLRVLERDADPALTVLEAGSHELILAYPDEVLRDAVDRMLRSEIGRLPVVDRDNPRRLLGYLGRTGVMEARLRKLHEEDVREHNLELRLPLNRP
jgi:CBS domain-containing protein